MIWAESPDEGFSPPMLESMLEALLEIIWLVWFWAVMAYIECLFVHTILQMCEPSVKRVLCRGPERKGTSFFFIFHYRLQTTL